MIKPIKHRAGFTIIEVVIGLAIVVFVITSGFLAFQNMARGEVNVQIGAKVDHKLQSIAEEIRQRSTTEFNTLNSSSVIQAMAMSPKIIVVFQIDPIDPLTGTRKILLTANWTEDARTFTKDLTFFIAPIRGNYAGGVVNITIIDGLSSLGIKGVRVTTTGQEEREVYCLSDENGLCRLERVQMVSGLSFKIDGYPEAYFHAAGDDNFVSQPPGEWFQVHVDTRAVNPYQPLEIGKVMYRTSMVHGWMTNTATGLNVPANVFVALRKKPGTLVIDNTADLVGRTDTNGHFVFDKVVPGQYTIHILGNYIYAGVAMPNDRDVANRYDYPSDSPYTLTPLLSGTTVTFSGANSLRTISRGDFELSVAGLEWDTWSYLPNGGPTSDVPFSLILRSERNLAWTDNISNPPIDMSNTVPYGEFYKTPNRMYPAFSRYAPEFSTVTFTDTSPKTAINIVPAVFHNDDGFALTGQMARTFVTSPRFVPDPYVPILLSRPNAAIFMDDPDAFRVLYMATWFYFDWVVNENVDLMKYGPSSASAEDFKFPVLAGRVNRPSDREGSTDNQFYLLNKNSLANPIGTIVNDASWGAAAGQPFNPCDDTTIYGAGASKANACIQISKVSSYFWDHGFGGVKQSTIHVNQNFLAHHYEVPTDINSGWNTTAQLPGFNAPAHTFSMKHSPCWSPGGSDFVHNCLGLSPNYGTDQTKLSYEAWPNPTAPSRNFYMRIRGVEKRIVGGIITTVFIPTGDSVSISNLHVKTSPSYNMWAPTQGDVNVTGWDTTISRPGFEGYRYAGSTLVSLLPGDNPGIVIAVSTASVDRSPFVVEIVDDADTVGDDENWTFKRPVDRPNVSFTYSVPNSRYESADTVNIYRKVNVNVTGKVVHKDNDTVGIRDVTVTMYDNKGVTLALTTTDSGGNYSFRDVKVVPLENEKSDFGIRTEAIGYRADADQKFEVYNNGSCSLQAGGTYPACLGVSPSNFKLTPKIEGVGQDL